MCGCRWLSFSQPSCQDHLPTRPPTTACRVVEDVLSQLFPRDPPSADTAAAAARFKGLMRLDNPPGCAELVSCEEFHLPLVECGLHIVHAATSTPVRAACVAVARCLFAACVGGWHTHARHCRLAIMMMCAGHGCQRARNAAAAAWQQGAIAVAGCWVCGLRVHMRNRS
jgi:hypothetical protein